MVNEITTSSSVKVKKGLVDKNGIPVKSKKINQAGTGYTGDTLTLAVGVDTVIPVGNLTTPGIWQVRHSGSAGTLEVGPEDTGAIVPLDELNPGEDAKGRIKVGAVLRVRALTAIVLCEYFVVEN